jgi:hypothetical protein
MPVEDITFNDMQFDAEEGAVIKEAKNIEFHNVRINTKQGSSLMAENVTGLIIDGVKTGSPVAGRSVIDLQNVENVFLYNCFPVKGTQVFLNVKGAKSKNIFLKNNHFIYTQTPVMKDSTVAEVITVE